MSKNIKYKMIKLELLRLLLFVLFFGNFLRLVSIFIYEAY
jgi:hypothetical protein